MSRLVRLVLVLACSAAAAGDIAASRPAPAPCAIDKLAFALPKPYAPQSETWAVRLTVSNTGNSSCRLTLPISLTLRHRSGTPLRVDPAVSRLTLLAPSLRPRARAYVTWLYTNYCARHNLDYLPIVYTFRAGGREVRGRSGTPPCHVEREPVVVGLMYACPGATGPAVAAVTPRPTPLCPR